MMIMIRMMFVVLECVRNCIALSLLRAGIVPHVVAATVSSHTVLVDVITRTKVTCLLEGKLSLLDSVLYDFRD